MAKITEGYMPFMGHETYYRIVGERKGNGKAPLLCLHGGPGSTHNYFEVLDNVADDDQRMIVMYDQIGCGNSYLDGHPELWKKEPWMSELIALRQHLGLDEHMARYCDLWLGEDAPDCCKRPKKRGDEAYVVGWGPNEFVPSGSLRDFEYIDRLGEITVPSLIMSGISDLCSPLIAKTMHDGIKGSEWILWERARHTCYVDRHDDYCVELIRWMNEHD